MAGDKGDAVMVDPVEVGEERTDIEELAHLAAQVEGN